MRPGSPADWCWESRSSGTRNVKETEILRHIKTRKDRNYDEQLVQEDLRRLFATRKFHNVRVHKKIEPQGVYVTFEVLERPMIDGVLFIGNQYVTDKKLLKESGLKQGEALNIYTVQEARRKVEEYYRSKGYSKTVVTIDEGDKPEDRRVVLRIDEGPVERIWSVRFVGNDPSFVTDARLKTLIKSKPGFLKYLFRGKVDYTVIEEDRERLTLYYRNLGYFKARISREIDYDASGQWATLTFVIDEGPRYRIRDLSVVGNKKYENEQLLDSARSSRPVITSIWTRCRWTRTRCVMPMAARGTSLPTSRRRHVFWKNPGNWISSTRLKRATCSASARSTSTCPARALILARTWFSIVCHCGRETSWTFGRCGPASGG